VAEGSGTPRWAQLTYASFDTGTGFGGWQVKQVTGDLSPDESERLRARVVTNFDAHDEVPQFATRETMAGLTRRFTYVASPDGTAAYWHSAQAGNDSTGRPGNVFSHMILDRDTADPAPLLRPIELWRSPDFLVPFGPEEVLAATFANATMPQPGGIADVEAAVDFLVGSGEWRIGVLCVLMDAVHAATLGGPRVVLITDTPDSAALWIDSVLRLTAPSTARTISWSLYERASALDAAWARGIQVCAVPSVDAELVTGLEGVVVLRESEMPEIGALGSSPHTTEHGSTVTVTAWSEMAQMALVDEETTRAALLGIDAAVRRVGDRDLPIAWPLSIAVMLGGAGMEDAAPFARDVILAASPDSVRDDAELFALCAQLANDAAGDSTKDAWHHLAAIDPARGGLAYDLAWSVYVDRAIRDPDWHLGENSARVLPRASTGAIDPRLVDVAQRGLETAIERGVNTPDDVLRDLRLLDFLIRSGVLYFPSAPPSLRARVDELLAIHITRWMPDPVASAAIVPGLASIGSGLRELLVSDAFAAEWAGVMARGLPGDRLGPALAFWLSGSAVSADVLAAIADPSRAATPMVLELAICHLRADSAQPGLASVVAQGLLDAYVYWDGIPVDDRVRLETAQYSPEDALVLETRRPRQLPDTALYRILASAPWGPAMAELSSLVVAGRPGSPSRSLAAFRRTIAEINAGAPRTMSELTVVSAVLTVDKHGYDINWREIGPVFLECAVILESERLPTTDSPEIGRRVIDASAPFAARSARLLGAAIDRSAATEAMVRSLAVLAVSTSPGFPYRNRVSPTARVLGSIPGSASGRLIDIALQHAFAQDYLADPARLVEDVATVLFDRFLPGGGSSRDQEFRELERFARGVLRPLGAGRPNFIRATFLPNKDI